MTDYRVFIKDDLPRLFPHSGPPITDLIPLGQKLAGGTVISPTEAALAMEIMTRETTPQNEIAFFLTALNITGYTPGLLATMATVIRGKSVRVTPHIGGRILGDTCGTGGDDLGLFNISTTIMFILATCGLAIAKHGNRASTSAAGSADVLEALGADIEPGPEEVAREIDTIGIGFMFAPRYHPAMKNVAPVRKKLPFRTIFNLLGPLCNPAPITFQLLGVPHPDFLNLMGETLILLGIRRALVVCGETGEPQRFMDEVSICGDTCAALVSGGTLKAQRLIPESYSMQRSSLMSLRGGNARENATILRNILAGREKGPKLDICLLNAAAGVYSSGISGDLAGGIEIARGAISSGRAMEKLKQFIDYGRKK